MNDGLPCSFWQTSAGFPSSQFLFWGPTSSLWRMIELLRNHMQTWGVWFMTILLTCKILRTLTVCMYLCCYSLQWTAAPWVFLCRLGGVDHKGRSRANRTVTGWGRASGSQTHKRCGQSHMRPQTGSRRPPPKWGVSIPMNKWHHHNQSPTVEDSSLPIFEFTKFRMFNPHAPP